MTDSTNDLVSGLVGDLTPVRPVMPLRVAFATVMVLALVLATLVLLPKRAALGAANLLVDGGYTLVSLGFIVTAAAGTIAAIASGRPGRDVLESRSRVISFAGWGLAAAACAIGLLSLGEPWLSSPLASDARCFRGALLMSIVPSAIVSMFVFRGWTHSPLKSALISLVAAGAIGGVVIHLGCAYVHPQHMLLGHVSVPLALAVVGSYPLGALLRRRHV